MKLSFTVLIGHHTSLGHPISTLVIVGATQCWGEKERLKERWADVSEPWNIFINFPRSEQSTTVTLIPAAFPKRLGWDRLTAVQVAVFLFPAYAGPPGVFLLSHLQPKHKRWVQIRTLEGEGVREFWLNGVLFRMSNSIKKTTKRRTQQGPNQSGGLGTYRKGTDAKKGSKRATKTKVLQIYQRGRGGHGFT